MKYSVAFFATLFVLATFANAKDPGLEVFDDVPKGKGFTTAPCTKDEQCRTGCCDGAKCRPPEALKPGVESCRNGLTPNFGADGALTFPTIEVSEPGAAAAEDEAEDTDETADAKAARKKKEAAGAGKPGGAVGIEFFDDAVKGDQFTTGPCTEDEECESGCCDGAKCRAPEALEPGVESCRNGLTPKFLASGEPSFIQI